MAKKITVGQISKALRCHEQSARAYLHEVNESIDRYTSNLAEVIDDHTVLTLCLYHADSRLGRRLEPLLAQAR